MCKVSTVSLGAQHNVHVFPIVTGTSSKSFKQSVMDYGCLNVDLSPFTLTQSLEMVKQLTKIPQHLTELPRFQRFVMSLGGIPRFLSIFCEFVDMWAAKHGMFFTCLLFTVKFIFIGFNDINTMLDLALDAVPTEIQAVYLVFCSVFSLLFHSQLLDIKLEIGLTGLVARRIWNGC